MIANRTLKLSLVLMLEVVLGLSASFQRGVDRGLKSNEQYWNETGLTTKELFSVIDQTVCQSSEQAFLACVNSISQAADKKGLLLSLDGKLRKATSQDLAQRWKNQSTEKLELAPWQKVYANSEARDQIQFISLFNEISGKGRDGNDNSALIATALNGYLSVIKDPHTYIMPVAFYDEVVSKSETRQASPGFVYRRSIHRSAMVVRKVYEGSPAERSGLRRGDLILKVDGHALESLSLASVNERLKFQNQDRLRLTVERSVNEKVQTEEIEIIKQQMSYPSLVSKFLSTNSRVALITINKFSGGVCESAKQHVRSAIELGARGLILDLRDNPGGQVDEAACLLNLFVAKGTQLFEMRFLTGFNKPEIYKAEKEPIYKGPLAVLINSGSASASEIVAGSLKDAGRATLIGEKTFGKGSFQDGRIWGGHSKIALFQTEGLYYFPSGWTPQLVGIDPDIEIASAATEGQRERDLYWNPVVPLGLWGGPQTLSWLNDRACDWDSVEMFDVESTDPQIRRAQAWFKCGAKNDRNGSL